MYLSGRWTSCTWGTLNYLAYLPSLLNVRLKILGHVVTCCILLVWFGGWQVKCIRSIFFLHTHTGQPLQECSNLVKSFVCMFCCGMFRGTMDDRICHKCFWGSMFGGSHSSFLFCNIQPATFRKGIQILLTRDDSRLDLNDSSEYSTCQLDLNARGYSGHVVVLRC